VGFILCPQMLAVVSGNPQAVSAVRLWLIHPPSQTKDEHNPLSLGEGVGGAYPLLQLRHELLLQLQHLAQHRSCVGDAVYVGVGHRTNEEAGLWNYFS
jgi:hypothetical protein